MKQETRYKSIHRLRESGVALLCFILLGSLALGQGPNLDTTGPTPEDPSLAAGLDPAMQATVVVVVTKLRSYKQFYLGAKGNGPSPELIAHVREYCRAYLSGSGFVVTAYERPYVLTNLHLVEQASDSAGSIVAVTMDGKPHPMQLICGDPLYDFAILRFSEPNPGVTPLAFRDCQKSPLRLGEQVFAIGNPLGEYPWTVSNGIVSGLHRNLGAVTGRFPFVQTTAPIQPGNSGGPLVDAMGQLVGMISQIAAYPDQTPVSQIGFALESTTCLKLLTQLIEEKKVLRPWFGIQLEAVREVLHPELPLQLPSSPMLRAVLPSARDRKELERFRGWRLVRIGETKITSLDIALEVLESMESYQMADFVFAQGDIQETIQLHPQQMEPQHWVEIANEMLLVPDDISGTLQIGQPVKLDVSGGIWGNAAGSRVTCFVLSAGILKDEGSNWYQIMKPEELGAAIQLIAMQRSVDLLVVPETQRSDTNAIRKITLRIGGEPGTRLHVPTLFH